jgi:hypothetical protein
LTRYVVGNTGAVLLGLVVAYAALVLSGTVDPRIIDLRTIDLVAYLSAGHLLLEGHAGVLYNWHAISAMEAHLAGQPTSRFGVLPFLYPPYLAFVFVPLALLSYGGAYLVWLVIDLMLLVISLYWLERYAGLEGRLATAFRWLSLVFLPVFFELAFGQVSVLLLALVVAAFVALERGHDELAGMALAVACVKPLYIAPIVLLLLVRRRRRAIVAGAATGAVLLVLPLPIFGPGVYGPYATMARQVTTWQGRSINKHLWFDHVPIPTAQYAPQWNHSFAGFAELLLPGRGSTLLYVVLCAATLGLVVWCSLRVETLDVPFGLAVVAGLLVSPHTLIYDYTLLLLPVAVALRYRAMAPRMLGALLLLGWAAVAVGYRVVFAEPVQITVVAALALAAWLVLAGRRSPVATRVPHPRTELPRERITVPG